MRVKIQLALVFLFVYSQLDAQVFEDLKAPTMPAGTVLGSQVNEISQPTSLRALQVSVLNNFMDSTGQIGLPTDYAVEFNPYMIGRMKNFDYDSYINPTFLDNLKLHSSVSLASTTNLSYVQNQSISGLGFGFRTLLLNGKVDRNLKRTYNESLKKLYDEGDMVAEVTGSIEEYLYRDEVNKDTIDMTDLRDYLISEKPQYKESIVEAFESMDKIIENKDIEKTVVIVEDQVSEVLKNAGYISSFENFRNNLASVKSDRYGFFLELDGAAALSFPTNSFEYSMVPKYSVWTNFSYRPAQPKTKVGDSGSSSNMVFILMGRYTSTNQDFFDQFVMDSTLLEPGSALDFGVRAVYEKNKFSFELEYIYRLNSTTEYIFVGTERYSRKINNDTYKLVFNANYNLTNDIIFSYNLGQNYNPGNGETGGLITGFTLNFGFGNPTSVMIPTKE